MGMDIILRFIQGRKKLPPSVLIRLPGVLVCSCCWVDKVRNSKKTLFSYKTDWFLTNQSVFCFILCFIQKELSLRTAAFGLFLEMETLQRAIFTFLSRHLESLFLYEMLFVLHLAP